MTRAMIRSTIAALVFASGTAFAAPAGLPGDEAKELEALKQMTLRFEEAGKDYRSTMGTLVKREYEEKKKSLGSRYQAQLDQLEKDEKTRRLAAIQLFEDFLKRYPNDERWTPDAMFRLAELYFEKSNEEYLAATQAGGGQATPDYQQVIDLYRGLIERFPNYRLVDGAYYLMGWCLGEMGKEPESLQVMRSLTCKNKYQPFDPPPPPQPSKGKEKIPDPYPDCQPVKADSRFLPEAWTRIGEIHFDNNELELAIAAYARVLKFTDSPYYDKALYKLAWAYYRIDDYPQAVKRFDELIVFSDKKKTESGAEGSDLRSEAIQYLAISFAEKDWNGDGQEDPETGVDRLEKFYRGRESEPHVREIYAKLGDIYFDTTEFFRAIAVYKRALDKYPYHPENPKLQDKVVMAFERQRDFDNALKERERLARDYTKGSDWYKKNRDNKEAIDTAAELAELALIQAAVNHHKAAQDLKKLAAAGKASPKVLEQIAKEYADASIAYEKYLEQYPNSKNTYEYAYSYADTLYYSGRFLEAAAAYERVRDSNLDNKYLEESAFSAIKSYEKSIEQQVAQGKYKEPPLPADGKVQVPVQPIPLPDVADKLQKAYDAFVAKAPSSGRVATIQYKAAEIDYKYLQWEKARPRLEQVLNSYCKEDMGANAGNAILVSYTIEKNLDKIEEWANKLKTMNCGSTEVAKKNASELGKLSLGVKFQKADKLFADKQFEEAARMYVQIVDADPKGEDADKALNNAAVAYENVKRFAAATKLYERIVTDYPNSKFLDDALFRTATSYQKGFDFDKAVVSFLRLAEDPKFANSANRTNSLYNAAVLLEGDQNYPKAAELFKRYSNDKGVKREEASEAYFRSALIYEKMKDYKTTIKALQDYVRLYGQDKKGSERVLEAQFHIALAYEAQKDRRNAYDVYRKIAASGGSAAPASEQAEYPAHAAFLLVEEKLPAVEKQQIKGGGKQLSASIAAFNTKVKELVDEYNKVIAYRRANWTLAAYFRIGYLYETFSKALLAAPCPPEVKKLGPEGCDIYREQIEQAVASVDEEAVKRYGVTLQKAGELGVSNEWTRLARIRANQYKPDVFPMTKDEHIEMEQP